MEQIFGIVQDVIFHNDDNGYTVCELETEDGEVTAVGNIPFISPGERIQAEGEWVFHLEYGEQFKISNFEKSLPQDRFDIIKYLSSGIIKGIGLVTAERIVDRFGEDSLEIIANYPMKLSGIPGISPKKAASIAKSYAEQIGVRDIVMFLQKYNISPSYAIKVYKRYGMKSVDAVKGNPYILAEEVMGIGFSTADKIANQMGIDGASAQRVEAGVRHCLLEAAQSGGHTYLPKAQLMYDVVELLNVGENDVYAAIGNMIFDDKVVSDEVNGEDQIYFSPYYYAELGIARRLYEIAVETFDLDKNQIDKMIYEAQKQEGIELSIEQWHAIQYAVQSGAIVITGGPGTGKTTIINVIIKIMHSISKTVVLAAPTGRAAKRMTEICGIEAKTIHRLLEIGHPGEGDGMQSFARDDRNPLDCDVLIVDELSMLDMLLMNSLLKAVKKGTHLILVGDADQLPSVGAGDVLRGIIESDSVPIVKLTEIFRQAKESMIVVNAHRINNGELPILDKKEGDFFFIQREYSEDAVKTIVDLCKNRLPMRYDFNPIIQIQVLTPMKRSVAGVHALNDELQFSLNPGSNHKLEQKHGNRVFREGDKVMQIKNNYNIEWENTTGGQGGIGVFNGDVGYIEKISHREEKIIVLFDEIKQVEYDFAHLDELELAYAITIHKSQGSEFDVVIMPMLPSAPMLQNRNLLYTGVTRAKKMLILVGRENIVETMVGSINEKKRFCGLKNKLIKIRETYGESFR